MPQTQTCFWYSPSQNQSYVFPRANPNFREPFDWKNYKQSRFNSLPEDTVYTGCTYGDETIAEAIDFYKETEAKILRIRM